MKTIKLILAASIVLLLCTSCEKDENGNRITYYKNKTGEGYVFYKFKNDSIAPIENAKVEIESSCEFGWFSTVSQHSDYVYTDNNGKYSFRFVKKISGEKVKEYNISLFDFPNEPDGISLPSSLFISDPLSNSNKIVLDTIFFHPGKQFPDEL